MCNFGSHEFSLLLLPQIITISVGETSCFHKVSKRCKMEQVFTRAALPFHPPHLFPPLLWDSLAPSQPSSYPGKVFLQNEGYVPRPRFFRGGGGGWSWDYLIPFTGGTGRSGTAKYCKERALLNEPRCFERGAVTLMMKAVARIR